MYGIDGPTERIFTGTRLQDKYSQTVLVNNTDTSSVLTVKSVQFNDTGFYFCRRCQWSRWVTAKLVVLGENREYLTLNNRM